MCLLSACLCLLNGIVLGLETTRRDLSSHNLFHKGSLPILVGKSRTEVLGGAFDDCTNLRVFWDLWFLVVLLVESFGIDGISHAKQLKVPLELWRKVRLGEVVPV